MILLVTVWSANGDGNSEARSNLLYDDAFVQVSVSSIRTSRGARCALYKKSSIYSMRKVFLEKAMVQSINLTRSPIGKVSRSLKYYSIFLSTNIPIYMDTNTDHFTPLALWVKKIWTKVNWLLSLLNYM